MLSIKKEPICHMLVMIDASDNEYYYAQNHIYSTVALIDDEGDVLERYQYDAYGQPYFCEPNYVSLTNQESGYDNAILFCGYRFDPETGKYHARHRDLDDYTGRWLTHDPASYIDGLNLYEYVKSSPINKYDPLGLWIIFRDNQPTAIALSLFGTGDTMATLAQKIGLEPSEFKKWASVISVPTNNYWGQVSGLPRGNVVLTKQGPKKLHELTPSTPICSGAIRIPNKVLTYWAGEFGEFGQSWVQWHKDVETLNARGFYTRYGSDWTSSQFESYITNATNSKSLHGLFFWGHGGYDSYTEPWYPWDPFNLWRDAEWVGLWVRHKKDHTRFEDWEYNYKMALGVLFACGTNAGRNNFSSDAIFWGSENVLVPHGFHLFGPTMDTLVPPGAQGTRTRN